MIDNDNNYCNWNWNSFYEMPPEIYNKIISFLRTTSLINISLTCKKFYNYTYFSKHSAVPKLFQHVFNKKIESLFRTNPKDVYSFYHEVGLFSKIEDSTMILSWLLDAQYGDLKILNLFKEELDDDKFFLYKDCLYHLAGAKGNVQLLKILMKNKYYLCQLETAFSSACQFGKVEIIEFLVTEKITLSPEISIRSINLAIKNRHEKVIDKLLEIDKKLLSQYNKNLILYCIKSQNYCFIKKFIKKHFVKCHILLDEFQLGIMEALRQGKLKTLKWLLNFYDHHYNENNQCQIPANFLIESTLDLKMIKFLIENERLDFDEISPEILFRAIEHKKINVVKFLKENLYVNNELKKCRFVDEIMKIFINDECQSKKKCIYQFLKFCSKTEINSIPIFNSFLRIAINIGSPSLFKRILAKNLHFFLCKNTILSKTFIKIIENEKSIYLDILLKYVFIQNFDFDREKFFIYCMKFGNIEVLKKCLQYRKIDRSFSYNKIIKVLCKNGKIEMLKYFTELYKLEYLDYQDYILAALKNNSWEIIRYLIKKYDFNYNLNDCDLGLEISI